MEMSRSERDGAAGVRRILGVLSLAKKHGVATVEASAVATLDCELRGLL